MAEKEPVGASLEQVRMKAGGKCAAYRDMTAKQRESVPSRAALKDYNQLRTMALEVRPEIGVAGPPAAEIHRGADPVSYLDLHDFVEQLVNLLKDRTPPDPMDALLHGV